MALAHRSEHEACRGAPRRTVTPIRDPIAHHHHPPCRRPVGPSGISAAPGDPGPGRLGYNRSRTCTDTRGRTTRPGSNAITTPSRRPRHGPMLQVPGSHGVRAEERILSRAQATRPSAIPIAPRRGNRSSDPFEFPPATGAEGDRRCARHHDPDESDRGIGGPDRRPDRRRHWRRGPGATLGVRDPTIRG